MEKTIGKKHNLMCNEDVGDSGCSTYLRRFPMILLLLLLLLEVAQVAVGEPALARVLQVVQDVVLGRALEDRLDRRRVV